MVNSRLLLRPCMTGIGRGKRVMTIPERWRKTEVSEAIMADLRRQLSEATKLNVDRAYEVERARQQVTQQAAAVSTLKLALENIHGHYDPAVMQMFAEQALAKL